MGLEGEVGLGGVPIIFLTHLSEHVRAKEYRVLAIVLVIRFGLLLVTC